MAQERLGRGQRSTEEEEPPLRGGGPVPTVPQTLLQPGEDTRCILSLLFGPPSRKPGTGGGSWGTLGWEEQTSMDLPPLVWTKWTWMGGLAGKCHTSPLR